MSQKHEGTEDVSLWCASCSPCRWKSMNMAACFMIEYPDLADQSTGEESTTSQQHTQDLLEKTARRQTLLISSED